MNDFKQKFKEGATSAIAMSQGKMILLFFTFIGFVAGGIQVFIMNSNVGLTIAFIALGGLQGISMIGEYKVYARLKQNEEDLKKVQEIFREAN